MIPSIPITIDFPTIKRFLDKIRLVLNALWDASPALQNRAYKFRLNVTAANHLVIEVAKRSSTPGQEAWSTFYDFGALPP